MLQIAIVVFREILEIALIVGILTAATKEVEGRTKWIVGGLSLGVIGSIILALFTDQIAESLDGMGQEFFNGLILVSAAIMIAWTVLCMQKHAKSLSAELKRLSKSVQEGRKPLYVLSVVIFLSVLREGAEIVLFTYSYFISGTSIEKILSGLAIGIALGSSIGLALYFGMLKAFGKYFFQITTWILVFLASGIAAKGIGFWVNADILPALGSPVYDSSNILSQQSIVGELLHIFLGYMDQPSGSQLIAYFITLSGLVMGLRVAKKM